MGCTDEHWCNTCRRSLDKERDEYLELTALNDPAVLGALNNKDTPDKADSFASALLCKTCSRKVKVEAEVKGKKVRRSLWVYLKHLRRKGNPDFVPVLLCASWRECATFDGNRTDWVEDFHGSSWEGRRARACAHIAADLHGRLYCKRRHPGEFEIPQERAVADEQRQEVIKEWALGLLLNQETRALCSPENTARVREMVKGFGFDPAVLHKPDPVLCGADMKPKAQEEP